MSWDGGHRQFQTLTPKTWAKGASHEKFHAAPYKKQVRFLEGPLPLRIKGKATFLEASFASKKVLRGALRGLPPFAPLLTPQDVLPTPRNLCCQL